MSLGKPLALLIYVACNSTPVSRDEVADLLWPGASRQKGRHSVRQALWVLRNAVGEDLFENHDPLSFRVAPGGEIRVTLPDGESSLVINRKRVVASLILLPTTPSHQWTLVVEGDAVGTEVLVRNLNIRREIRY